MCIRVSHQKPRMGVILRELAALLLFSYFLETGSLAGLVLADLTSWPESHRDLPVLPGVTRAHCHAWHFT